ncbi:hypothetical protein, partial [Actinomadura rubrisoli]|uniref:hypothetical protein n=1 Tax=Actinomadura rubrisoli TaxID=2530368 RepID=UPI001A9F8259
LTPMPGRPWGRHLMIRPLPGAHIAVPGWLTSSVIPVEHGQHVLVAIASTVRKPSRTDSAKPTAPPPDR